LYTGGIYITLDDPSATQGVGNGTEAFGINASSQIVGVYGDNSVQRRHGFLYNPNGNTYTTIDDLHLDRSRPFGDGRADGRLTRPRRDPLAAAAYDLGPMWIALIAKDLHPVLPARLQPFANVFRFALESVRTRKPKANSVRG
jgi:hypothetical protein